MNPTLFHTLWQAHPGVSKPCDPRRFENQCAVRVGVALDAAKIKVIGVRRCATVFPAYKSHHPGHILGAQELADALAKHPAHFGSKVKTKKMPGSMLANMAFLENKKGVLFIMNGWGTTDHIDLWNGHELKGGMRTYFNVGEQIWFWQIA